MERIQGIISRSVAIIMIAAMLIVSCSVPQAGPGRVSSSVLVSASGRAICMYLDDIRQFVDPELPEMDLLDGSDGYDIATRTLEEENGREYLEFALETSRFSSADDVFQAASTLVPEAELEEVKKVVEEAEERLFIAASATRRATRGTTRGSNGFGITQFTLTPPFESNIPAAASAGYASARIFFTPARMSWAFGM